MKTLIIGAGEIGRSLYEVLSKEYECTIIDKNDYSEEDYDIIHICFPFSANFRRQVKEYQIEYDAKLTVIHSTVPVGTSRLCNAVHSPVVGLHPNLAKSLTTFTKFIGGDTDGLVAEYFRRAGFKVYLTSKSESTELMKVQSTTLYSMMIEFYKDMKNQCFKYDVPFELFTLWNMNYNDGYEKLGYPEYKKPLLIPIMKKQGGHCTLPNLQLIDTKFTKFLKEITDETV